MDDHHDESTLQKVYEGLRKADLGHRRAQDAINCIMNEGIVFREIKKKESFAGCETLEELIFQAIGAASTCWESLSDTGQFDSNRAKDIGDEVVERIRDWYSLDKSDGVGPQEAGVKQDGEAHDMDNKLCTCNTVTVTFSATCKDLEESERVLEYFSRAAAQMANDQIPVSINLYNLGDSDGPLP